MLCTLGSLLVASTTLVDGVATRQGLSETIKLPCFLNEKQHVCSVTAGGDNLELRVDDTQMIKVDRRGHCRTRRNDAEISRSCNVKVGLVNDFVYGLIVRSNTAGTRISTPRLEIKIPDLKFTGRDL